MQEPHIARTADAELNRITPNAADAGATAQARPRAAWLRLGASLCLFAGLLWFIDVGQLLARLRGLDLVWTLAALGVCGSQFLLLAARWRFIAAGLGVPLRYRHALAEYALSTLLNQVLPMGVMGDALRALRHRQHMARGAASDAPGGRIVMALVLDRVSGQMGLWSLLIAVTPWWWAVLAPHLTWRLGLLVMAGLVAFVLGLFWLVRRSRGAVVRAGAKSLLSSRALVHLPLSLLLVISHAAVFFLVGRALGIKIDIALALRIVPLLLAASTLPAFFAGFGIRELTAASLYGLLGLHSADGATISLVYGALGLLAATPGLFALKSWR